MNCVKSKSFLNSARVLRKFQNLLDFRILLFFNRTFQTKPYGFQILKRKRGKDESFACGLIADRAVLNLVS